MLTPEQLKQLPNNLIGLYGKLEEDILADMAARITAMNLFIPAADWQFQKLAEMGNSYDMILRKLSAATKETEQEINDMMVKAASESLKYDDEIHKAAGKQLPPLNQSAALLVALNAGVKKTQGYFENLCRTTANQGSKQFANALDRAYMQVTSGAFSQDQAIKMAIKDLASQGINAATYKNDRTMSLEAAVRMNVVTGINQTCAELQLQRADEAGCDLVETTAHAGARPSHAEWQGRIFSLSGKHKQYPEFISSTGYGSVSGLCGANCRHNFYPFYDGLSEKAHSKKELEQFDTKNAEYNGEKMNEYEVSQVQRKIERNIRRWKRENVAMRAASQDTAESAAKLKYWRQEMDSFIEQTGLKRQYSREQVLSNRRLQDPTISGKMKRKTSRKAIADNTSKLKAVMSESDYAEYLKLLNENSNAGIQTLYAKYGDRLANITLSAQDGYYVPGKNTLLFSYEEKRHIDNGMGKYSALAHEYGHAFDALAEIPDLHYREIDMLNAHVTLGSGRTKLFHQKPSSSDEFLDAIRKDREYLRTNFKSIRKDLLSTAASAGVQDAISGMFSGAFDKSVVHWGHNDKYYDYAYNDIKRLDLHKALKQAYIELGSDATSQAKVKSLCRHYETASEMWANIISAQTCGGAELAYVKKYLPNSYEALLKIIGKVE